MARFVFDLVVSIGRMGLALIDLAILLLPCRDREMAPGRFGFLIHSRDLTDLYRWFPVAKYLPEKWQEWFTWHMWPIRVGRVTTPFKTDDGHAVEGWLLAVAMTAEQMMQGKDSIRRSRAKMHTLFLLAERLGLQVVGLGAYSASVTDKGKCLKGASQTKPTTGHAFTSAAVFGNTLKAAETFRIDLAKATIGIAGAGSIGTTCALLLAGVATEFVIVDQSIRIASELAKSLNAMGVHATASNDLTALKAADIVIVATTATNAILKPEHLKEGAIVVDDSMPRNITEEVARLAGVTVVDVVVKHPLVHCGFDFGLQSPNVHWGCLVETILAATMNGKGKCTIGMPDVGAVRQFATEAEHLGFEYVLRSFNREISADTVHRIVSAHRG